MTTSPTATPRILHPGETLSTTNGTADVMLAPGTLLRLGQDSTAQIVASTSGRAEARVESGRANVAVNALAPKSLLLVDMPNGQTQLLKRGLYTFDVPSETMRVFNGEADAFPGANTDSNVKPVKVKDDHEVLLSDNRLHPAKFDQEVGQGDLLPWTGPQEAHADGYYGFSNSGAQYVGAAYTPVAYYGYSPYALGFGYGYGYPYGYGFGSPYGFGYPFGFGFGYGFGYPIGYGVYGRGYGYYGGRRVLGGVGVREGYAGSFARRGGGFAGGGFHSGFAGGGFHGGFAGGRR